MGLIRQDSREQSSFNNDADLKRDCNIRAAGGPGYCLLLLHLCSILYGTDLWASMSRKAAVIQNHGLSVRKAAPLRVKRLLDQLRFHLEQLNGYMLRVAGNKAHLGSGCPSRHLPR